MSSTDEACTEVEICGTNMGIERWTKLDRVPAGNIGAVVYVTSLLYRATKKKMEKLKCVVRKELRVW